MTTTLFLSDFLILVNDLSQRLSAKQRYQNLLKSLITLFPCDACALLKLEQDYLLPIAIEGLSEDTLGRRFVINEQPRLATILGRRGTVRFDADSILPDPYNGLIETETGQLHVHDCMGVTLYIDETPWGILTLDALKPNVFDNINQQALQMFIALAEANIKIVHLNNILTAQAKQVFQTLHKEQQQIEMISECSAMQTLMQEINAVAASGLAVLILGETGVGKELVAQHIHSYSKRSEQAMVYVNCAALPENIAESELFGHTKGAFSGAINDRSGKFELANGGTIFLDEVGELPLSLQAKILRTLQNGEIQRVGSDRHIKVDIRVIAATNRNLQKSIAEGLFRADLYHRLAVYPLHVPPLRERGKDILLLSGLFLEKNKQHLGVQGLRLDNEAKEALLNYHWPGNIRELEHLLSRAALKAVIANNKPKSIVTISCAHLDISGTVSNQYEVIEKLPNEHSNLSFKTQVENFQKQLLQQKLTEHDNNIAKVAKDLSLDRGNLHRLLKRLQII